MARTEREPIPAARRKRFPAWPNSRLPESTRRVGLRGVAAAREELERHGCDGSRSRAKPRPAARSSAE